MLRCDYCVNLGATVEETASRTRHLNCALIVSAVDGVLVLQYGGVDGSRFCVSSPQRPKKRFDLMFYIWIVNHRLLKRHVDNLTKAR